jgi:hypothetical protein
MNRNMIVIIVIIIMLLLVECVGTSYMNDIRQTSVAMERLVDSIFMVTNHRNDFLISIPWQPMNAIIERNCVFYLVFRVT